MDPQRDIEHSHGNLAALVNHSLADLFRQAGRIIPDHKLLQDVATTAFAGGIVDDRKYIVLSFFSRH
jgi:hypothetical protein